MIVVGEILHLQRSFQGALGLDNCVRYRCNRPRLYLKEEHSTRWKFCLVNQKLFQCNLVRFQESVSSDPQKTQPKTIVHVAVYRNVPENIFHNVWQCTEKAISKVIWVGKGALMQF